MALSKDSEVCKCCEHYDNCDTKRMEACAFIVPKQSLSQSYSQPLTSPLAADMAVKHDYRNIKIAENTTVTIDLEELKKKMREDVYKIFGCGFLREG